MSLYLIYDTQLVIGEKKNFIKMDLYILGAMMIYLDIITLFLKILRLFGTKKKYKQIPISEEVLSIVKKFMFYIEQEDLFNLTKQKSENRRC